MDAMYDEYGRRLSDFSQVDQLAPFDVHLFARRVDYMKFTDNRLPNTGGVFISGENKLAAFLEGQGRDGLRRTLQHEAFHQFAHAAISPDLPVWINEGLAQVFEEGLWTGDRFWIGHVPPRRVRQLQADLRDGRIEPFEKFMHQTHESWASTLASDAEGGAARYNQAWAMIHFLIYAGDESNNYRERLLTMLSLIHRQVDGTAAFERAFGTNYEGFQTRFTDWARNLSPSPEAAMIERHEMLADMLIEFAKIGKRFSTVSDFRQYAVRSKIILSYRKGNIAWQSSNDVDRYFRDADGKSYTNQTLCFDMTAGQLPAIVARPTPTLEIRARFVGEGAQLERDIEVRELSADGSQASSDTGRLSAVDDR